MRVPFSEPSVGSLRRSRHGIGVYIFGQLLAKMARADSMTAA
jgi:Cu2+-containing amine oxidase